MSRRDLAGELQAGPSSVWPRRDRDALYDRRDDGTDVVVSARTSIPVSADAGRMVMPTTASTTAGDGARRARRKPRR
jgi:hypothetical protein